MLIRWANENNISAWCVLAPRYIDDEFPSELIDYRVTEPAPYESYDEYLWFIEQMRKELDAL